MTEITADAGIIAFLTARLDEDQAIAREAAGLTECWVAEEPAIGVVLVDGEPLIEGHIAGLTAHIARHDPARALSEVAAKRAMLAELTRFPFDYRPGCNDQTRLFVHLMASAWSDHPDYRPEWALGDATA